MSEVKTYPVISAIAKSALINDEQYQQMYRQSLEDPDTFWATQADKFVSWFKKWDKVSDWNFDNVSIKWFLIRSAYLASP